MDRLAAPDPICDGDTCWQVLEASRAALIVDADSYFRHARAAMLKAERRIMLIGWDFDARIALGGWEEDGGPRALGEFIHWLVKRRPQLEVYLLRWDVGALKSLLRGTTIASLLKWMLHPRIHIRLDGHHPAAASHHQKIVVIDDCFAFCGGIDMTAERWDTRAHADGDPRRVNHHRRPYQPWHDATMALEGPAAAALGHHARARWKGSGGAELAPVAGREDCWPPGLGAPFRPAAVAIARTAPAMRDQEELIEIERLYLRAIRQARRFVYAESQYFASRRVAEAIAARLAEPDGPEFVIVNPVTAHGWLEPVAMDTARARLVQALRRRDPHQRLRLYHPVTAAGTPIYVHAKIMVVDDRLLRVGSSNMNNRSMRLDTECDVAIDVSLPANRGYRETIRALRDDLMGEHLGVAAEQVAAAIAAEGSLIGAIERLRGAGGRTLVPYEPQDLSAIERWLADNEVLDAEGPGALFEQIAKGGLLRRLRRRRWRPGPR